MQRGICAAYAVTCSILTAHRSILPAVCKAYAVYNLCYAVRYAVYYVRITQYIICVYYTCTTRVPVYDVSHALHYLICKAFFKLEKIYKNIKIML